MKIGIVRFPGTNCDEDVWTMVKARGHEPRWLWHRDRFNATELDAAILPGGFSFGDYLRCGALAARSPVMDSVREFAGRGGPVLGICNGFQVLCESGLLPGVLVRNQSQKFIDGWVDLEVVNAAASFNSAARTRDRLRLPIAHGEGCFRADPEALRKIEDGGQVWLKYVKNPNGSLHDIAGVLSADRKVAGLMPHPERALWDWMGGTDGWRFL